MPARAIKTTTISILVIGLLAGSAVGVAAQDEDPAGAAYFTGTIGESAVVGEPTEGVVAGVLEVRGLEREGLAAPGQAARPRAWPWR